MIKQLITSHYDINGRRAANLVYSLSSLPCNIWIIKDDRKVNAKSILGLLSAAISKDDNITVLIDNNDAQLLKEILLIINE